MAPKTMIVPTMTSMRERDQTYDSDRAQPLTNKVKTWLGVRLSVRSLRLFLGPGGEAAGRKTAGFQGGNDLIGVRGISRLDHCVDVGALHRQVEEHTLMVDFDDVPAG